MTHMIDVTTGRAAIAYRNETPWHGLGQKIGDGQSLEQWALAGGINYDVRRAAVQFSPLNPDAQTAGYKDIITMPERHVLYRSDTWKPLSVVGSGYKVVQPRDILELFRDLIEVSGFKMDTVGALSDGKRVWALAETGVEASIIGKDVVKRFMLAATSYDATMSTIVKFVDERVVCHNTITAALGEGGRQFKVHHGKDFDAKEAKKYMGVAVASWDQYVYDMKKMAQHEITKEQAEGSTIALLANGELDDDKRDALRETRGFKRIMSLFDNQIGGDITEGQSAWKWLNAVTQFVDWEKGVTASSRMNSAWFGDGDAMKSRALKLATV